VVVHHGGELRCQGVDGRAWPRGVKSVASYFELDHL
jgi:hypothetical protein